MPELPLNQQSTGMQRLTAQEGLIMQGPFPNDKFPPLVALNQFKFCPQRLTHPKQQNGWNDPLVSGGGGGDRAYHEFPNSTNRHDV